MMTDDLTSMAVDDGGCPYICNHHGDVGRLKHIIVDHTGVYVHYVLTPSHVY